MKIKKLLLCFLLALATLKTVAGDEAKLTILGVPDMPGVAHHILGPIGEANIEVVTGLEEGDRVVQRPPREGRGAIQDRILLAIYYMNVVRDSAEALLAIINDILDFSKIEAGKLTLEDLAGGTFSITNGGTFGSMLSTPLLNPPQSAILGMHNISERAVVENGEIVIRPIMYVALSYDHRLIDGRDAVQFLVSIKQNLEDPSRLLIGL